MNILKALFGGSEEKPEEKRKEDESRNFDVLKYDGVKAMRAGQPDYAEKCFTHALSIREDLEIRDYLSQVYVSTGKLAEACEQLRTIAEAHPDNPNVHLRMAGVAYMMEDYEAMADASRKAMQAAPDSTAALCLYARSCKGRGERIEAVAILTKAIAIDGGCADALLQRGELLLQMGDSNGAASDADELLKLAPDSEEVLLLKARVETARGNKDEAVEWYGKVTDANPFCAAAYKERGAILYEKGMTREAAEDMQKVLELEPENASGVNGEFSAEGIEDKLNRRYKAMNPYGF